MMVFVWQGESWNSNTDTFRYTPQLLTITAADLAKILLMLQGEPASREYWDSIGTAKRHFTQVVDE